MRPRSIVSFERLYLISLLLVLVQQLASFFFVRTMFSSFTGGGGFSDGAGAAINVFMVLGLLVGLVLSIGVPMLFWWLTAQKRKEFGKWVLLVLSVLSVIGWLFSLMTLFILPQELTSAPGFGAWGTLQAGLVALDAAAEALGIAALVYLFRPDASAWLSSPGPTASADVFR